MTNAMPSIQPDGGLVVVTVGRTVAVAAASGVAVGGTGVALGNAVTDVAADGAVVADGVAACPAQPASSAAARIATARIRRPALIEKMDDFMLIPVNLFDHSIHLR